MILYHFW